MGTLGRHSNGSSGGAIGGDAHRDEPWKLPAPHVEPPRHGHPRIARRQISGHPDDLHDRRGIGCTTGDLVAGQPEPVGIGADDESGELEVAL